MQPSGSFRMLGPSYSNRADSKCLEHYRCILVKSVLDSVMFFRLGNHPAILECSPLRMRVRVCQAEAERTHQQSFSRFSLDSSRANSSALPFRDIRHNLRRISTYVKRRANLRRIRTYKNGRQVLWNPHLRKTRVGGCRMIAAGPAVVFAQADRGGRSAGNHSRVIQTHRRSRMRLMFSTRAPAGVGSSRSSVSRGGRS
jgi:hypothetical protein